MANGNAGTAEERNSLMQRRLTADTKRQVQLQTCLSTYRATVILVTGLAASFFIDELMS